VPQRLLVPRSHVLDNACKALVAAPARHVGLADRAHDGSRRQVAVKSEKALEVHVQILANGLGVAIPATNAVDELKRQRVDRRRGRDRRSLVQTRHARRRPENIGDTDDCGHIVSISVEDDGCRVESRV